MSAEALRMYREFLRCAKHFGTSYNIKEYVKRRARLGFEEARAVTDAGELQRLWQQGKQQLEMVRRQSIVYDLYSHKHKHTMDLLPKTH